MLLHKTQKPKRSYIGAGDKDIVDDFPYTRDRLDELRLASCIGKLDLMHAVGSM